MSHRDESSASNGIHTVKLLSLCMDMMDGKPVKAMKNFLELNDDERIYAISFATKLNNLVSMSFPEIRAEIAKHEG